MRTAQYNVIDLMDGDKQKCMLVVYDDTQPCVCCELPIGDRTSVSAPGLCGSCDMGKDRSLACSRNKWRSSNPTPKDPWYNVTERFLFDTREQSDRKMYELHQQGIQGWAHVIKRCEAEPKDRK